MMMSPLKKRRIERGLSQAALAEASGVDQPRISRLENNPGAKPQWETVRALALALGCKPEVIFPTGGRMIDDDLTPVQGEGFLTAPGSPTRQLKVIVCGNRDWTDREAIGEALTWLRPTLVAQGGSRGADRIAHKWAAWTAGCDDVTYDADVEQYGASAGPRRNLQMLEDVEPDLVLAFYDPSAAKSRGTRDMVKKAETAGVPVWRIFATRVGGGR